MSGLVSSIHPTVSASSHGLSDSSTVVRRAGSKVGILAGWVKSRPNQLKIGESITRRLDGSSLSAPLARKSRICASSSTSTAELYGVDRRVGQDTAPQTSAAWIRGSRKRLTLPCSIRSRDSGSPAIVIRGRVNVPGTPSIESAPVRATSAAIRKPVALYTLIQNASASDGLSVSGSTAAACLRYRSSSPAWSGSRRIGFPPAIAASTAANREWSNVAAPPGCGARTRTRAVTMDQPARNRLGEVSVMERATCSHRSDRELCRTTDSRRRP